MAPADRGWSVCPQCGASNGPGRRLCFLCGNGLDTARTETRTGAPISPAEPTTPESFNPYAPSTNFFSPALTFRISSLLMVTAVIAVCLGVARENLILGAIQAVAVAPALGYTVIVAARSKARGRPMAVFEKVSTFLFAVVGVVVIAVSAFIAFCVTCIPAAFAAGGVAGEEGFIFALVISGTAAIAAAAFMTHYLITRKRRRGEIPRKS